MCSKVELEYLRIVLASYIDWLYWLFWKLDDQSSMSEDIVFMRYIFIRTFKHNTLRFCLKLFLEYCLVYFLIKYFFPLMQIVHCSSLLLVFHVHLSCSPLLLTSNAHLSCSPLLLTSPAHLSCSLLLLSFPPHPPAHLSCPKPYLMSYCSRGRSLIPSPPPA